MAKGNIDYRVKKSIDSGIEYLEKNDLDGFYNYITVVDKTPSYLVGEVTKVLEQCGIDTSHALHDMIPDWYSAYNEDFQITGLLDPNDDEPTLTFNDTIKVIGVGAFAMCKWFEYADFRGIKYISNYAFQGSSLYGIWLPDPNDIEFGKDAFRDSNLKFASVPQGTDIEATKDWFKNLGYSGCEIHTY